MLLSGSSSHCNGRTNSPFTKVRMQQEEKSITSAHHPVPGKQCLDFDISISIKVTFHSLATSTAYLQTEGGYKDSSCSRLRVMLVIKTRKGDLLLVSVS